VLHTQKRLFKQAFFFVFFPPASIGRSLKMADDAATTDVPAVAPAPAVDAPKGTSRVIELYVLSTPFLLNTPFFPFTAADPNEILRRILSKALEVDGVRRGLHESLKALAKGSKDSKGHVPEGGARLAILAKSASEKEEGKQIQKLVKALAMEKNCNLVEVDEAEKLGEWCVFPINSPCPSSFPLKSFPVLSNPTSNLQSEPNTLNRRCGLCKIDKDGKPRKIVPTSCAVITDFGDDEAENDLKVLFPDTYGK